MSDKVDADQLRRLEQAVAAMPRIQREIFLAHGVHAMSYVEIASRTGLSVRQVELHIAKAIYKLCKQMDGHPLRLATYAASRMTPDASDHQLLLDQPIPLREATDRRWKEALCLVDAQFDRTDEAKIAEAFTGGDNSASLLPRRFGYYVGYRLAAEAARQRSLADLARLDDEHARPVVAKALAALRSHWYVTCRGKSSYRCGGASCAAAGKALDE